MNRRAKNSRQFYSKHADEDDDDDDDGTTSLSQSPYESNGDDDDYLQRPITSESVTNSDQLSSNTSYSNSQPSNSYINVAPLPVFHGNSDECPLAHLSRFVKVCRANNASSTDMMMRIFPVTLENEAALWYDLNIEPYPSLSWDQIKSSFLEAYNRIALVDQLRSDLMMLNQGRDESVRSYFLRLQWILKRWPDHGLSDNMLKGIFIDGLMASFKDWIIPHKPNSLSEALRLAFSFEQMKSIRTSVKCGLCEGSHEESRCDVRDKLRKLLKKSEGKKMIVSLEEGNGSNEAMKESKDDEEGDVNEKVMFNGMRSIKRQCQCSKHQCWIKKLDRNNSGVSRNSTAE